LQHHKTVIILDTKQICATTSASVWMSPGQMPPQPPDQEKAISSLWSGVCRHMGVPPRLLSVEPACVCRCLSLQSLSMCVLCIQNLSNAVNLTSKFLIVWTSVARSLSMPGPCAIKHCHCMVHTRANCVSIWPTFIQRVSMCGPRRRQRGQCASNK